MKPPLSHLLNTTPTHTGMTIIKRASFCQPLISSKNGKMRGCDPPCKNVFARDRQYEELVIINKKT